MRQLRSIGSASHHETDGTVAKMQTGHRRSTRDVQVPTSSTVLFVKKLLGWVKFSYVYVACVF